MCLRKAVWRLPTDLLSRALAFVSLGDNVVARRVSSDWRMVAKLRSSLPCNIRVTNTLWVADRDGARIAAYRPRALRFDPCVSLTLDYIRQLSFVPTLTELQLSVATNADLVSLETLTQLLTQLRRLDVSVGISVDSFDMALVARSRLTALRFHRHSVLDFVRAYASASAHDMTSSAVQWQSVHAQLELLHFNAPSPSWPDAPSPSWPDAPSPSWPDAPSPSWPDAPSPSWPDRSDIIDSRFVRTFPNLTSLACARDWHRTELRAVSVGLPRLCKLGVANLAYAPFTRDTAKGDKRCGTERRPYLYYSLEHMKMPALRLLDVNIGDGADHRLRPLAHLSLTDIRAGGWMHDDAQIRALAGFTSLSGLLSLDLTPTSPHDIYRPLGGGLRALDLRPLHVFQRLIRLILCRTTVVTRLPDTLPHLETLDMRGCTADEALSHTVSYPRLLYFYAPVITLVSFSNAKTCPDILWTWLKPMLGLRSRSKLITLHLGGICGSVSPRTYMRLFTPDADADADATVSPAFPQLRNLTVYLDRPDTKNLATLIQQRVAPPVKLTVL
jgi:hypothetical protein